MKIETFTKAQYLQDELKTEEKVTQTIKELYIKHKAKQLTSDEITWLLNLAIGYNSSALVLVNKQFEEL